MTQEYAPENIDTLMTCFYQDEKILRKRYSDGSYKDLKNEFYNKAYNAMVSHVSSQDIYELLQMIDNAKNKKDIKSEKSFGYSILAFEPTESWSTILDKLWDASYDTNTVKNRMALFCLLVDNSKDSNRRASRPLFLHITNSNPNIQKFV